MNKIEAYHDISFNSKMDKYFNLDESIFVQSESDVVKGTTK